jgi:HrpA-like RNA helicase
MLVFVPSMHDGVACKSCLPGEVSDSCSIFILHDQSSWPEISQAAKCSSNKIIFATKFAETGFVFEHISAVIDSGLFQFDVYDSNAGQTLLGEYMISQFAAEQRSACLQVNRGVLQCYRLYTLATFGNMTELTPSDLSAGDCFEWSWSKILRGIQPLVQCTCTPNFQRWFFGQQCVN